jgi:hypothetical protein
MSDDIVERLREYAEEWQIDRSVVDRAANEIIRLRALVESSVVLAQPGSLTVNCVRGTVACQEAERLRARAKEILFGAAAEIERLRARVEDLERALIDARQNGLIYWNPPACGVAGKLAMIARIDAVLNKEAKP